MIQDDISLMKNTLLANQRKKEITKNELIFHNSILKQSKIDNDKAYNQYKKS